MVEIKIFGFGTIQIALLVLYYGNLVNIPLWLAWLPCLSFLVIIFCILFAIFIIYIYELIKYG
jgi:hypothetical protein